MSQYGVIWMEEALQKLQQENTRLRQERDQLLEALEEIVDSLPHKKEKCNDPCGGVAGTTMRNA